MLYPGQNGRSLVSEEFNRLCTEHRVEAKVQASPNPGDPLHSMRLITFTNFNNKSLMIIQKGYRPKSHHLPAKGTLEIMLAPDEPLPEIQQGIENA
jgi:hypothetical protein